MDLRNVPSRTEVLAWTPEILSDYFRKLNYKDCEKVVKKHTINGQRFLNMSENDIQKFPKLRVPIIIKLCQEISKKQEKKNPFRAWTQTQKVPDEPEQSLEEGGWSSFEDEDDEDEGDYESPDETMEGNDGNEVDYESPAEDVNPDSDGDYEPPPPNDEPPHHGVILPSKSIQSTPVYVDRPTTAPVPPQRPLPSPGPFLSASKGRYQPNHNVPSLNDDKRTVKPLKSPAIDRRTKPSLPLLQAMSATNSSVQGTRTVPEKVVPKIPKPPLPAEKKWDGSRMSSTSPRPSRPYNTNSDKVCTYYIYIIDYVVKNL
ncbi:lymphocyte cytosolic protein 2 [Pleurodeles waltl]|uniref:lymphocyte cytosolic protein 2 n=1 Tax=Pleurodeles waltl TaxID=8319 RepID=UPI003709689E